MQAVVALVSDGSYSRNRRTLSRSAGVGDMRRSASATSLSSARMTSSRAKSAGLELSSAVGEIQAVAASGGLGARVWGFTGVPAADAGRFNVELFGQAGLLSQVFENALGHGAAANVAQTHKTNANN